MLFLLKQVVKLLVLSRILMETMIGINQSRFKIQYFNSANTTDTSALFLNLTSVCASQQLEYFLRKVT